MLLLVWGGLDHGIIRNCLRDNRAPAIAGLCPQGAMIRLAKDSRRSRIPLDFCHPTTPRKYVRTANIPGMDDRIAAGKCRERLRPQQAMGIGNRANRSHYARSDYKRSRVRRAGYLKRANVFRDFSG